MAAGARLIRAACAALAVLALGGCAIVDYEQRRWIFQPIDREWAGAVEAARGLQDVWIEYVSQHPEQRGETVRLHGLWARHDDPSAPVALFLHGVRWDVRASAPRMRALQALGFSVLGIDYRGFGRSSGAMPSETLAAEDTRAAWDWLGRTHPQARRFVAGHSLGAAIAVQLAHDVGDEAGLIVEGAFTSTSDLLHSTRWGWLPVHWMITQRFESGTRIGAVGSPVLVVHAGDDTMVDPRLGRELYERAAPPKRFVLVRGAVHENVHEVGQRDYAQALHELFGLPLVGIRPPAPDAPSAAHGAPARSR